MAQKSFFIDLNGNGNQLINWRGENLAADPTGGDLTLGRYWYNTTDNVLKYYDGTSVQSVATLNDLADIGRLIGVVDASGGFANLPTTRPDGSAIQAGDYVRVSVAGTIVGIGADDNLEVGDLVFAIVDSPATAADWTAIQANLNLSGNLAQVEEVALTTLAANTATAVPTTLTNVYSLQVFDSANEEIGVKIAGPSTAPTVESNSALSNITIRVVGQ